MFGASIQSMNSYGAWTLPSGYTRTNGITEEGGPHLQSVSSVPKVLPSVSRLRNFFENLNKEEDEDTQQPGVLKRGKYTEIGTI